MTTKKKKRAKYGTGSLRRRASGVYDLRVSYVTFNGEHKRKCFTGQNESECREKAKRFLEKYNRFRRGDLDPSLTIPQIARMKVDKNHEYNFTKESTYRRNLGTIKIIENTPLGTVPIIEIDERMLDTFLTSLKKYANSTIQKVFQVVNSAFEWAKENHMIDANIITAHHIRCPRSDKKTNVCVRLPLKSKEN